jgi:hypothetical protein
MQLPLNVGLVEKGISREVIAKPWPILCMLIRSPRVLWCSNVGRSISFNRKSFAVGLGHL